MIDETAYMHMESKCIGQNATHELYRRVYTAPDGSRCFLVRVLANGEVIAESPILYTPMAVTGFITKYAQQFQIPLT